MQTFLVNSDLTFIVSLSSFLMPCLELPFYPSAVPAPAFQRRFLARFLAEGLGGVSHLDVHLVVTT